VDLFESGSGSQVHDYNGGILTSGLFWILPLENDELQFSRNGRYAALDVERLGVIDSFSFGAPGGTPATLGLHLRWAATGPSVDRGKGTAVPATDPAHFLGRFAVARSTAVITGSEFGFRFQSNPGASTDDTFAEVGRERNGASLL
jgi:hypothetical protein